MYQAFNRFEHNIAPHNQDTGLLHPWPSLQHRTHSRELCVAVASVGILDGCRRLCTGHCASTPSARFLPSRAVRLAQSMGLSSLRTSSTGEKYVPFSSEYFWNVRPPCSIVSRNSSSSGIVPSTLQYINIKGQGKMESSLRGHSESFRRGLLALVSDAPTRHQGHCARLFRVFRTPCAAFPGREEQIFRRMLRNCTQKNGESTVRSCGELIQLGGGVCYPTYIWLVCKQTWR